MDPRDPIPAHEPAVLVDIHPDASTNTEPRGGFVHERWRGGRGWTRFTPNLDAGCVHVWIDAANPADLQVIHVHWLTPVADAAGIAEEPEGTADGSTHGDPTQGLPHRARAAHAALTELAQLGEQPGVTVAGLDGVRIQIRDEHVSVVLRLDGDSS